MALDEARARSQALWDRMAPGWEKHNTYMWDATRQVGEWLVEHVEPKPGQTILDIAAGPGNTGFAAAAVVGDSGRVISTDFAEAMVTAAENTAKQLGVTNVEFKTMDAEKMDLADDSVDGVICRWGFMLMLDPDAALRETRRVLRPGGKLAFSVWAGPEKNPWITLSGMVLSQRGTPPQGDPWGPGGMFSMADHEKIRTMVTEAGYEEVVIEDMPLTWTFEDFDDFWSFQTELAGAIAAIISQLSASEAESLKTDLKKALEPLRSGDGYSLPAVTTNVQAG